MNANEEVTSQNLAADICRGADQIAQFIGTSERRIYHLARIGALPVFREGAILCARKSELRRALSAKQGIDSR